ncbi:MAG: hypothetical protein GTO55_08890, partial [Armatimonadetes bacterium]|nr:hypothetical protein [Armatimonadota bacterium]NIM24363.1 hypothetical protein [Armatimonadota bacterium]NIM68232.1 hypothetical protein [Armatimonadota bacterium]NIM75133.1 hypothetical protein [Armatimonadota bacterium]NIN06437.1 hypothetical protein [Armatimonadota bacterium]
MRIKYLLLTTLAAVALCRSCPGASIGSPLVLRSEPTSSKAMKANAPLRRVASVAVAGSKVSLGDLRSVIKMDKGEMARLESVVIAISPLPGKTQLITRKQILQRLHRHGFAGGAQMDCPEAIQVTRSSITVSAEEIVAAGENLLRELNPAQEGKELIITPITLPRDVIVAEGEIDITAEPVGSV